VIGSRPRGVLVVGAAGVFGRSVLEAFSAGGHRGVGAACPGAADAPPTAPGATESRTDLVSADVAREEEAERLFETAVARLPGLDVVVWIAEGSRRGAGFAETSLEDWEGTVSAPLREAGHVCRLAVSEFLSTGEGGRIVLVAPPVTDGAPGQAGSAAASSALAALGRSVAKEYGGRGIACNVVLPRTGLPGAGAAGLPEAVLYLASAEASYVNGECLRIDVSSVDQGVI